MLRAVSIVHIGLSFLKEKRMIQICFVKIYKWLLITLTLAQVVFTIAWFLLIKKFDGVIILSSLIYAACMMVTVITYEVEKYRRRKKELIDNLP